MALPPGRGRGTRPADAVALTPGGAAVAGWCGMRGTVTLAAALALPTAMPFRDLIVVTAFAAVLGTLVLQGLTLRPLLLHLRLEDDGMVEREVRLARVETLRAAVAAAAAARVRTAELVRHRYELQLRRAEEDFAVDGTAPPRRGPPAGRAAGEDRDADVAVVRAATDAQRQRLAAMRADGTIGDAAFQQVQEALDWAELDWAQVVQ